MVGRLVEQQQVRALQHQQRESQAGLLAPGKGRDTARRRRVPEAEAAEEIPHLLLAHIRGDAPHQIERGATEVELLDPVLGEIADTGPPRGLDGTTARRQVSRQPAQQGRLSHPVRPQQGDPIAACEDHRDLAQDRPGVVPDGDRVEGHRRPWQMLGLEEVEGETPLRVERLDYLHPFKCLDPALRLPRLARLVTEPIDERLDPRPLATETGGGAPRVLELGRAQPLERTVVPRVDLNAGIADQRDVIDDRVKKLPIMGDQQQRARVASKPRFQPDHRVEVEMIGGLVEKEQLCTRRECAGECRTHPPTAGQRIERLRFISGGESESAQDPACLCFGGVAVDGLQVCMGGGLSIGVAACLGGVEPGADGRDARVAVGNVVDEWNVARRRFLGDGPDRDAGWHIDLPAVGFERSEKQAEEARLARPVRPDHPDLPAALNHQRRPIEDLDPAATKLDIVETNHRAPPRDHLPVSGIFHCGRMLCPNNHKRMRFILELGHRGSRRAGAAANAPDFRLDGSSADSGQPLLRGAAYKSRQRSVRVAPVRDALHRLAISRAMRFSGGRSLLPANARSSSRCTRPTSEL